MEQAQENKPTVDMKKVVWIGVNTALVTLLLGAVIAYFVQKSRFTEFHDEYYKISIKYPKSWAVKRDIAGALVTFFAPKDNELDTFSENLNISVQDVAPDMTLEKFSRIAAGQMEAVFEKGVEVIKSEPFVFNSFSAYNYEMRGTQFPLLTLRFVWFFKDGRAYVITYAAETLYFDKHRGTLDSMVKSFSLGK